MNGQLVVCHKPRILIVLILEFQRMEAKENSISKDNRTNTSEKEIQGIFNDSKSNTNKLDSFHLQASSYFRSKNLKVVRLRYRTVIFEHSGSFTLPAKGGSDC